jgi:hypothetical protein
MKKLIQVALGISGCVLVLVFVIAQTYPGSDTELLDNAKASVRANLVDPDSANFDAMRVISLTESKRIVCGLVNAKNRLGGYIGYQPFFYNGYAFIYHGDRESRRGQWNEEDALRLHRAEVTACNPAAAERQREIEAITRKIETEKKQADTQPRIIEPNTFGGRVVTNPFVTRSKSGP